MWPKVADYIDLAIACLVGAGAHKEYEIQHQKSAFFPLVDCIWKKSKLIPPWLAKPCLTVLKKADTQYFEVIKNDDAVLLTLRWAAAGDRCELVQALLDRDVSVHSPVRGFSALTEACLPGTCTGAIFKMLLQKADTSRLDDVNIFGRTPLLSLCYEHDTDQRRVLDREQKLEALIKAGANKDYANADEGNPPAVLGILRNLADCTRVLLENGADHTKKNLAGMDIALAAAYKGCLRVLTWIQSRHKDTWDWQARCSSHFGLSSKKFYNGCNALHIAAMNGQVVVLEYYVNNGYLSLEDQCFDSKLLPIHFAAIGGNVNAVRFLADRAPRLLNARAADGTTPLHHAVRARHPEIVRVLLELGCETESRDKDGITPLIEAIKINAPIISGLLFEKTKWRTSVPEIIDNNTKGILAKAMESVLRHMDVNMCEAVLKQKCPVDVELPSCGGCTPLLLAIRQGKASMVKFLLGKGASRFVGLCEKHFGPNAYSAVHEAARKEKSEEYLPVLLGAAIKNDQNWLDWPHSPLHIAAEEENLGALKVILNHVKGHSAVYR
jgi:ankyrin repeat protein